MGGGKWKGESQGGEKRDRGEGREKEDTILERSVCKLSVL